MREACLIAEAQMVGAEIGARRLASWMSWAFHDPKNMPDVQLEPARARAPGENRQADVVYVNAFMRALTGRSNGG